MSLSIGPFKTIVSDAPQIDDKENTVTVSTLTGFYQRASKVVFMCSETSTCYDLHGKVFTVMDILSDSLMIMKATGETLEIPKATAARINGIFLAKLGKFKIIG